MASNVREWVEKHQLNVARAQQIRAAEPTETSVCSMPARSAQVLEPKLFEHDEFTGESKERALGRIRASAAEKKSEDSRNQSAAAKTAIASAGRVAIDQYGVARFLTMIGKRFVPVRLDSQDFRDICQSMAVASTGKPLGKDSITSLVEVLRANAVQAGAKVEVNVRIATHVTPAGTRCHVLDLSNDSGEIVLASPRGWKVAHNDRFAFLGGGGSLPRPLKPQGVEEAYEIASDFLERNGIVTDLVLIVLAVLCDWFRADTAHPVLNIIGAAGGGKSSLARSLISVIDPTQSGKLPETKIEEEHIAASAQSRHILVADNASHLSRDAQDLLCRCVYGYETSQRRLYTQTEVERLPVHNPVIITSILPAITAPDLHDRAIRVAFRPRRQFNSQAILSEELESERGRVLGALLTLLSAGMSQIDRSSSSSHRLVDFALLGDGIAAALGHPRGHFSDLLKAASRVTASDYSEGDDLIIALRAVLSANEKLASSAEVIPAMKSWTNGFCAIRRNDGSYLAAFGAAPLLAEINRHSALGINAVSYPRSPRALASALELKLPVLSALGIRTEKRVLKRGPQTIWIFKWR